MKSQWKSLISCVAVATAVTAIGAPGDRQGRGPIDLSEVETRAAEAFARVDTVADGMITMEEFIAAEPNTIEMGMRDGRRAQHDRRGPPGFARPSRPRGDRGEVDEEALAERRAKFEAHRAERQARRDEHRDTVFSLADTDGSGDLSKSEYDALPEASRIASKQEMFARLDTNGDEYLTAEEFPPHLAKLRELDTNGDGMVTRDEMPRRRPRG